MGEQIFQKVAETFKFRYEQNLILGVRKVQPISRDQMVFKISYSVNLNTVFLAKPNGD